MLISEYFSRYPSRTFSNETYTASLTCVIPLHLGSLSKGGRAYIQVHHYPTRSPNLSSGSFYKFPLKDYSFAVKFAEHLVSKELR